MARNVLYLVLGAVILSGCFSVSKSTRISGDLEQETHVAGFARAPVQVLRHVVLFKFKEGTTNKQIREIETAFCALPSKIDAIHDYEWGTNVSVEEHSQGFTHCFFVTFRSEADRAKYLPHPAHEAFGAILGPHLDKVLVVDYWAR